MLRVWLFSLLSLLVWVSVYFWAFVFRGSGWIRSLDAGEARRVFSIFSVLLMVLYHGLFAIICLIVCFVGVWGGVVGARWYLGLSVFS